MDKLDYLIRTLSRTKRKDYENYVVNAIWNRLGADDIKPVTQQPILHGDGHYSFIDLYFPQIMVGVECDEAYHESQHQQDADREVTIAEVLRQIKEGENEYYPIHIKVNQPYEKVEAEINKCVDSIAEKVRCQKEQGKFTPWCGPESYIKFYHDLNEVDVSNDIGFPRIVDAVNLLCDANYKGFQTTWFIPSRMRPLYGDKYAVWFPKLAVANKAVARGWNNELSKDWELIYEYNENRDVVDEVKNDDIRITFARSKDPITRVSEYRFVGVFKRIENSEDGKRKQYKRIATTFPIYRAH
ncbi:AbaSI family restriction endonuclease [Bifidobacterium bombi]|uniref:Uncharacterized protein n=1 Tax=Bifidobacterium bombi DSM 19703 TaxID=1341695 RepID=A0A086BNV1_9BIFI|nr:restriction endonuclease [Bifidobacterium bombi]KFF30615.1 hypothetical protein BBOMB_1478 [Bifidobacterium bombi DSM 19703]